MSYNNTTYIYLLLTFLLCTGCADSYFSGSNNIVSTTRELPEFTRVVASIDLDISITQNNTQLVEVIVNDNLQERILTNVSGNTLFISLIDGSYRNETFQVNIQVPSLEKIQLNDNTRAEIDFSTNQLELEVNGSSEVNLQGTSEVLYTNINDDGRINALLFITSVLNTTSRDASEIEITCSNELNGSIDQAARVSYRGMPVINARTSEDGQIININ